MIALKKKIHGCLAATRVASAMGAAVEGWDMSRITEAYGVLDELLPYHHYDVDWDHPAGSTEDGIERQKLMCAAIMAKQSRITASDLIETWIETLNPENMKYMTEAFDRDLLAVAKTALVPAWQLGQLSPHRDLNTTARSFHAIPIINAGNPAGAVDDMYEIGRVYQPPQSNSFAWGAPYNAAVAAAFLPDSTVESVIETGMSFAQPGVREKLEKAVELGKRSVEYPLAIRSEMNGWFDGRTGDYAMARIDENVCKAFAAFVAVNGDPKEATILGVNFGRDTDCTAASIAGLAGALRGIDEIPAEWIEQVELGTRENPYTNSHMTIAQTAEGMHAALLSQLHRMADYSSVMLSTADAG
jgi:ADP-ribosylglycohydrolase